MSDRTKLDRRGFLGIGAVAVAGAGLGAGLVGARSPAAASFDTTDGFPDKPAAILIAAEGVADGVKVVGQLSVETPNETLTFALPPVALVGGLASVPVTLVYPYDVRVPGTYRYSATFDVGGRRVATRKSAAYDVRRIVWFS